MDGRADIPLTVDNDAIANPQALAAALRPLLTAHPVPQSDERTRGLLREFGWRDGGRRPAWAEHPALEALLGLFTGEPDLINVLAVNETPPGSPDDFLLRPHVDRRWLRDGFGHVPPRWTAVAFLAFPDAGKGGELAVFPPGAFDDVEPVARDAARQTCMRNRGILIAPRPGRLCRFAGQFPHAVLGYSCAPDSPWRLSVVLAEFPPSPDEPPPREFLPRLNRG